MKKQSKYYSSLLAGKLEKVRNDLELSILAFSEVVGMNSKTYEALIYKKRGIGFDIAFEACQRLGISIDDLE